MTHEAEIARLRVAWDTWAPIFGLDRGWDIGLAFYDDEFITQRGHASGKAEASVETSWQYQHASVWWNTERSARLDADEVEECVAHEMAHIVLNELRTYIPDGYRFGNHDLDHEERVCTVITRAVMRVQERGQERVDWLEGLRRVGC